MHIYTRTGDKGKTGLANGSRISKDSPVINFLGNLDELNASIGLCVAHLKEEYKDFKLEVEVLESIQSDLFKVGSIGAGANIEFESASEVENIEETINDYEKLLPPLKNFILPGGNISASHIHLTRSLVRKIEREAVGLNSKSIEPFLPYLNRLSDLLFVMARYINFKTETQEIIWYS